MEKNGVAATAYRVAEVSGLCSSHETQFHVFAKTCPINNICSINKLPHCTNHNFFVMRPKLAVGEQLRLAPNGYYS